MNIMSKNEVRQPRSGSAGLKSVLGVVACAFAMFGLSEANAATVTVNNTLANGYKADPLGSACPNGITINLPTGGRIERPHYIYNSTSKQWVLWAHYEATSGYTTAEALVATSASECGTYSTVKTFQPLGEQIRDDFLFQDTDGKAYFLAASNKDGGANDTMAIFRLTSDYLDVDSSAGVHWAFEGAYREAPIVAKSGSVYFLMTSQAAGWLPSQGGYATSTDMLGTWSALANLGDPATFGGQNADLQVIKGSSATANILILDHLGGPSGHDDGNMWLPVTLNASAKTATLDWYSSYTVDTSTGVVTLPGINNLAKAGTASASSTDSSYPASNANDGSYYTRWAASSNTYPQWWQVDLGSTKSIHEIDMSWYMVKGSEALYTYNIQYSTNGTSWSTIDRSTNTLYGFTNDKVSISARYLKINILSGKQQNNGNTAYYAPSLWHVRVLP